MLSLRQTVLIVAALNLGYFGVEFVAALKAGSVSLLADSADFLEDAAVNILIFFALAWTATRRAAVGKVLAALLLIPAAAFLWTLGAKLMHPTPPSSSPAIAAPKARSPAPLSCPPATTRWRTSGSSPRALSPPASPRSGRTSSSA